MELILWLLVSYYLADHLITDTAYAVRGLDPPRHKERMARLQSGGQAGGPALYRSGRQGASRFFAEAWHDAWDDAHAKRQELRTRRKAKKAEEPTSQPRATGDPEAQPDGTVDTPGALRPQEREPETGNVIPLRARTSRASRSVSAMAAAGGRGEPGPDASPGHDTPVGSEPSPSEDLSDAPGEASDAWESVEYTHCEHCPVDDGPGGTVRHRPDLDPPGDLCDECYGRRAAAEVDPDSSANDEVTCEQCGEERPRYDMDLVRLNADEPELLCPDCIHTAGASRPRRYTGPDPTAEHPSWPPAEPVSPADTEPASADPMPQPDGTVDIPEALCPPPDDGTARQAGADDGRGSAEAAPHNPHHPPEGDRPAKPRPAPGRPPTSASSYPSLFTTPEEWDAHQATLDPETRRTLAGLDARINAANGATIPVTVAEQTAILRARGYAPDVAREAAEQIRADAHRRGGVPGVSGYQRLPGEEPDDAPNGHGRPTHGQPAADRGGPAEQEHTQEETRMSVMTSTNNGSQPSGETAGLGSAIRFAEGMANSMRDAASRTETSVASLTGSEVGAGPIAALQQAMEAATNAAAAYEHAKAELERQLTVKEAYDATPDAGNKQFLQSD